MTDSNYTHIAVIADRSGSMNGYEKDMVGGLNTFFKEQAELPGLCLVDYVQFDDKYEVVFKDKHVSKAKAQLEPRGMTALLDAVGKTVTTLGEKLAAKHESERPGKVIVVVVTDGYENASRDWTAESVKKVIRTQEDEFSWEFIFLGANMDAVAVGEGFGFKTGSSLTYNVNDSYAASSSLSASVSRTRSGLEGTFTDEEREAQNV